jgi:hypothetical protein
VAVAQVAAQAVLAEQAEAEKVVMEIHKILPKELPTQVAVEAAAVVLHHTLVVVEEVV